MASLINIRFNGPALFTADKPNPLSAFIEKELLENKIDIAVHALKDMPSIDTKGLITNCFLSLL